MKVAVCSIPILCLGMVLADSAVMFEFPDGRSVALTSSGEVEMLAESVSIVPAGSSYDPWGDDYSGFPYMDVRCMFELRNTTDESVDITVGFPIDAKFGDSYTVFSDSMLVAMFDTIYNNDDRIPWFQSGLNDGEDALPDIPPELNFTAEVDGESLEVFYRTCRYSLEEELVWRPVVAVWRMHFDPGQTVRLVNTYRTSWDYFSGGPWQDYTIRYILTTGSTWKGSIGQAVVTLVVPDDLPSPGLSDTLVTCWNWEGSPAVDGSTVTWEFTDLEPDFDLEFSVSSVDGIDHWDYYLTPGDLVESVTWSREELLPSTNRYLRDNITWGSMFHSELLLRLLEAGIYIDRNQMPPDTTIMVIFPWPDVSDPMELTREDEQRLKVIDEVREDVGEWTGTAGESDYLQFLPLFIVDYTWEADDIPRYASMREIETPFLEILRFLPSAQAGAPIPDRAVESFFMLTGWYMPGDSLHIVSDIYDDVIDYLAQREI